MLQGTQVHVTQSRVLITVQTVEGTICDNSKSLLTAPTLPASSQKSSSVYISRHGASASLALLLLLGLLTELAKAELVRFISTLFKERKGKGRKGKERKGKEGKERKGKQRKGKERKGKERKGKESKCHLAGFTSRATCCIVYDASSSRASAKSSSGFTMRLTHQIPISPWLPHRLALVQSQYVLVR